MTIGSQGKKGDQTLLRWGAISLVLGFVLLTVFSVFLAPQVADHNDMPVAFAKYARSDAWIAIHMGEVLGILLVLVFGAMGVYRSLVVESGTVAGMARLGLAMAVIAATLSAVLQGAVEGIALKKAVDAWASTGADTKVVAFGAAQTLRWTEIGLNAIYNVYVGIMLLLFGIAMVASTSYPSWVGWIGAFAGLGEIPIGVAMGYSGFSGLVDTLILVPIVASGIWIAAVAIILWRRSNSTPAG